MEQHRPLWVRSHRGRDTLREMIAVEQRDVALERRLLHERHSAWKGQIGGVQRPQ